MTSANHTDHYPSELESYKRIAHSLLLAYRQSSASSSPSASAEGPPSSSTLWLPSGDVDRFRELIKETEDGACQLGWNETWCLEEIPPILKRTQTTQTIQKLPLELLLLIAQELSPFDLAQFCATSLAYASTLLPTLYRDVKAADWGDHNLFCNRLPETVHSRVNDLLSLSNISNLTLHASFLETESISHDRLPSGPLLLRCLTLLMDIDEAVYAVEEDDSDSDSGDDSSMETHDSGTVIGKAVFFPNLFLFRSLDPCQLTIEANSSCTDQRKAFAAFFIKHETAQVISSWSKLRVIRLKQALFYTTTPDTPNSNACRLVPHHPLPKEGSFLNFQFHLHRAVSKRLPSSFCVREAGPFPIHLLPWLYLHLGSRPHKPLSLCYPNKTLRVLLEKEKKKREKRSQWADHFRICSVEEAEMEARMLLEKEEEAEVEDAGMGPGGIV